ncbi:hypothetical protein Droror1_Dr00000338 [Drosera rotundifolia]
MSKGQLYFDKITELSIFNSDSVLFKEALVSLATDSGLHPLVPYFTCFIADEVQLWLLISFSVRLVLLLILDALIYSIQISGVSWFGKFLRLVRSISASG